MQAESLGAPVTKNDSDIQARIEGSSLARLLSGETPLSLDQGYKLEGRLQGGGDQWKLSGVHARSGKTELHGSMTLDIAGKKPFFQATLDSPVVNLALLEALNTAWTSAAAMGNTGASMLPTPASQGNTRRVAESVEVQHNPTLCGKIPAQGRVAEAAV